MITERLAVEAARAYADRIGRPAWEASSVRLDRRTVHGYDCWFVMATDVPPPDGPDWLLEYDGGQSYLVDVTTGTCIGEGLLHGYAMLVPKRG